MWENLVGRSLPFWRRFYPELQRRFARLQDVDLETFYGAVNTVQPSFIRVEADEVTYNLHVILRSSSSRRSWAARSRRGLPEAWNARMKEYLGVDVPNDAQGVLQDVHWSFGVSATSRPTRSATCLGSDLGEGARGDPRSRRPDRGGRVRRAARLAGREPAPSRPQVHAAGDARALHRVDAGPYLRYLKDKLGGIYGLTQAAAVTIRNPTSTRRGPPTTGDALPRTGTTVRATHRGWNPAIYADETARAQLRAAAGGGRSAMEAATEAVEKVPPPDISSSTLILPWGVRRPGRSGWRP